MGGKSACEGLQHINKAVDHERFSMNVNLSGRQFEDDCLPKNPRNRSHLGPHA